MCKVWGVRVSQLTSTWDSQPVTVDSLREVRGEDKGFMPEFKDNRERRGHGGEAGLHAAS